MTKPVNLLASIDAELRAGQRVTMTWPELSPYFGTDANAYRRLTAFLKAEGVSFSTNNLTTSPTGDIASADVTMWAFFLP